MVAPLHVEKSDSNNNCGQSVRSTNIGRRWHVSVLPTLVLARSANDAGASTAAQSGRTKGTARLSYGSGKTKGEASQSSSIPLLPLREPAPPTLDDAGTYPSCQRCFAATLRVRQDERRSVPNPLYTIPDSTRTSILASGLWRKPKKLFITFE